MFLVLGLDSNRKKIPVWQYCNIKLLLLEVWLHPKRDETIIYGIALLFHVFLLLFWPSFHFLPQNSSFYGTFYSNPICSLQFFMIFEKSPFSQYYSSIHARYVIVLIRLWSFQYFHLVSVLSWIPERPFFWGLKTTSKKNVLYLQKLYQQYTPLPKMLLCKSEADYGLLSILIVLKGAVSETINTFSKSIKNEHWSIIL